MTELSNEEQLRESFRNILETNSRELIEYDEIVLTEDIEDIIDELLKEVRLYVKQ